MYMEDIIDWLKEILDQKGLEGYVLGLSGGVDSAVAAGLVRRAVGTNHLALIMPCSSDPDDEKTALKVADCLDIRTKKIDLSAVYKIFTELLPDCSALQKGNIKARLRMITLYHYAFIHKYLVVGTGNKTEYLLGYFTKYGDGACDVAPLRDFLKREVRMLAEELGLPSSIVDRPPSAGLWPGQTDEEELGYAYDVLDKAVVGIEKGSTIVPFDVMEDVIRMNKSSAHKREKPIAFMRK